MKAIIFDLYNTLIYTEDRRNPYVDFFNSLGLSKGEIKIWLNEVLTNNYKNFDEILQVVKPNTYLYTNKWDYEVKQEIKHTNVFDDTYFVLDSLKSKYKLFLLSNISTPYKEAFYNLKLDQYFDDVFFSCDIGYRKPKKEAFEYVMQKTGFKSNQMLMIGDSITSDLKGATDAGIPAILKNKSLTQIYQDLF